MSASAERRKEILELLRGCDAPLTAKQIAKTAVSSTSAKEIESVRGVLEELRASGDAFEFAPERTGAEVRFWCVAPADWLGDRIVSKLKDAGGRLTLSQARSSLRKWETRYFDQSVGKLVKDGRLFYLTVRSKYLLLSAPTPFDHLLPRQVTALKEILERVNRHRKSMLSLEEIKAFLDGSQLTEVATLETSGQPSEDLLREWYRKDVPRRGGLSSIPIPWTWAHYESWCLSGKVRPDVARFQDFLWGLHRAGKVELIPHSMTQEISTREAELSLRGQHGEVLYYWKWR